MDELLPQVAEHALAELGSIAASLRMGVQHMICMWMSFGRVLAVEMAGLHDRVEHLMRLLVRMQSAAMKVCDDCRARIECERARRSAAGATA